LHDPPFLMYIPHIWPGGGQCGETVEKGIFYDGNDIAWRRDVKDAKKCAKMCNMEKQCHGWSHFAPRKMCYLKTTLAGNLVEFVGAQSGPKPCADNTAYAEEAEAEEPKETDNNDGGEEDIEEQKGCIREEKITYSRNNMNIGGREKWGGTKVENQAACAQLSFAVSNTSFWTYLPSKSSCWVKTSNAGRKPHPIAVSGNSECGKTGGEFLTPVTATQSSTHRQDPRFEPARCIDGDVGPDKKGKKYSFCHTKKHPHPWLAIDYGKRVNVQRVDIFNRRGKWGKRTEKVEVRISDQPPTSSKEKFSGGTLLGNFEGTGANPQHIVVSGKETAGRYVIVQINKGPTFLNLKEVKAFGRETVEELQKPEEPQNPEKTKNPPGGLGFALTTALNEMGQGK